MTPSPSIGFERFQTVGAECLAAALDYCKRGWHPLPLCNAQHVSDGKHHVRTCKSPGKVPLLSDWTECRLNADELQAAWKEWPFANVGLLLGVDGCPIVGIDVDGDGGEQLLEELSKGDLPPTLEFTRALTSRRLLYRIPAFETLQTTSRKADDGELRIMASGSQTVAPPSLHASGDRYIWATGRGPGEIEIALAPAWVCDLARRKIAPRTKAANGDMALLEASTASSGNGESTPQGAEPPTYEVLTPELRQRVLAYLSQCPAAISGQHGHDTCFAVARAMTYSFNLGPDVAYQLLQEHYNPRCQPPWSAEELRHKVQDADEKPFDKERGHLLAEGQVLFIVEPTKNQEQNGKAGAETPPPPPPTFAWEPLTSAAFAVADYRLEWVVKNTLVQGQPAIIGGCVKTLKTGIAIDLALSVGSGCDFLNAFPVHRPSRVALLSGESGGATIRETAKRICKSKGIELTDADVLWQFALPQLASAEHLKIIKDGIERDGVKLFILDPLYLALLAGVGPRGPRAENVFEMGPLLLGVARVCLEAGATPVLLHHTPKGISRDTAPLELTDLAYAGSAEFARQWILLSRRKRYEPGTGEHRLWMNVGGSAGFGSLWTLNVDEGAVDEQFDGRHWEVDMTSATEARRAEHQKAETEKQQRAQEKDQAIEAEVCSAVDKLKDGQGIAVFSHVRDLAGLNNPKMNRAVLRLVSQGTLEEVETTTAVGVGRKGKRPARGLRRKQANGVSNG
jgi:hypothetical protein